ncbi:hypothetical protein L2E82_05505 [Cichorium intybus]|uniref:Uncharacterized protein n=1 Tax=Cichorium intybus TaxID=13427 RepID=A0ACB9H7Z8_CICIN|nr:hypothetical protein L2E82_05505 [Cichorium intybus]
MDPSFTQESRTQKSLVASSIKNNSFSSSMSKISGCSKGVACSKNFNFYFNFEELKNPIQETSKKPQLILQSIVCEKLWGKTQMGFPKDDLKYDEIYKCLINISREMFDRFDVSLDEIKKSRHKGQMLIDLTDDNLEKRKVIENDLLVNSDCGNMEANSSSVKIVSSDDNAIPTQRSKVSFHMNWIPKPQDVYKILVNNVNQPFQHVWLQTSDDGSRLIHPLEKLSIFDFIEKNVSNTAPTKPTPVETTPFKLVQDVKDLKELVAKLHGTNEFAVDLEHNQYRSFQGLTCLMQISTRTEDFIVDTLKLRVHIGPYMREIFKDPTKRKASRVLKMERNSLDYLLLYFCGVIANKEYQTADWRFRPLTDEMLRYAREDTHYLLYIYDLMKKRLLSSSTDPNHPDALLVEVYQRSYNVCMQLYQKVILTELHEADLNGQQLSIVAALCEWRDIVARAEDESTGYVLPNKILIEIAKKMPVTNEDLRGLLTSNHPNIERNLTSIVSIIQNSMYNAAEFEGFARRLKEKHLEILETQRDAQKWFEETSISTGAENMVANQFGKKAGSVLPGDNGNYQVGGSSAHTGGNWNPMNKSGFTNSKPLQNWGENLLDQKNSSCKFKAVPRNATGNRKLDLDTKLQQINPPFNFPSRAFTETHQTPNRREANVTLSKLEHGAILPECGSGAPEKKRGSAIDLRAANTVISSSFQKSLQTSKGTKMMKQKEGGSKGSLEMVPFGYAAARKELSLKEDKDDVKKVMLEKWIMKKSVGGCKDAAGESSGEFTSWVGGDSPFLGIKVPLRCRPGFGTDGSNRA